MTSGDVPGPDAPRAAGDPESPGGDGSPRKASSWPLAMVLVVAYVAVMAWVGHQRVVGDYLKETDF